ncbi:hypothetical protein HDU93_005769, partial [Gonapodya sp. JEL0774]
IISIGHIATDPEQLQEIVELAVNIATDCNRNADGLYIAFVRKNLAGLRNEEGGWGPGGIGAGSGGRVGRARARVDAGEKSRVNWDGHNDQHKVPAREYLGGPLISGASAEFKSLPQHRYKEDLSL